MTERAPGWYPDPTLRHAQRYFDGGKWTAEHAADDGGVATTDPLTGPPLPEGMRDVRRGVINSLISSGKYKKPLREGTLAGVNLLGGSWNEYADVALSALMLETLLDIDARLEYLTDTIRQLRPEAK